MAAPRGLRRGNDIANLPGVSLLFRAPQEPPVLGVRGECHERGARRAAYRQTSALGGGAAQRRARRARAGRRPGPRRERGAGGRRPAPAPAEVRPSGRPSTSGGASARRGSESPPERRCHAVGPLRRGPNVAARPLRHLAGCARRGNFPNPLEPNFRARQKAHSPGDSALTGLASVLQDALHRCSPKGRALVNGERAG